MFQLFIHPDLYKRNNLISINCGYWNCARSLSRFITGLKKSLNKCWKIVIYGSKKEPDKWGCCFLRNFELFSAIVVWTFAGNLSAATDIVKDIFTNTIFLTEEVGELVSEGEYMRSWILGIYVCYFEVENDYGLYLSLDL